MNDSNALAQLKDIHLPEPISWWPPALGWWLLAGLMVVFLLAAYWFYHRWQKGRYRRAAIRQVKQLFNHQTPTTAGDLNRLLKAVAQQSYSTREVSRLTSREWLDFLDNSASMQAFGKGAGQVLATAPYEKNPVISNAVALKRCSIRWIRRHK